MRSRRREAEVRPEAKWDYISLNDFKSTNCFTPLAYGYLWFSLLLSIAVYSVDTFTAIQLLVFNKWSSEIEPTQLIPFDVSKWIFSICIILSFVNLGFEHVRAQRIMRRGSVAESYLDNLTIKLQSIRLGKGQGWKRFLVFAELTKNKKGAEYVALFSYYSFQSWIRVILCSGPRQAVNAMTLLSVYNAKIAASGDSFESSLMDFFDKIGVLAREDGYQQALILSGMCFTLVIWVFSALSLLLAALFWVFYLSCAIPRTDGGLSGYCERKVNKRLMKIVSVKVNKAIAEQERQRMKAELKAAKKAGEAPPEERKATLPTLEGSDDSLPQMPMMNRNDTMATLPVYTSRPGTPGDFELNALDQKRPMPNRTGTMSSSTTAFSSRAPLLGGAAEMGIDGRSASPAPSLPSTNFNNYPGPPRTGTAASNRSFGGPTPLSRVNTGGSGFGAPYTQTPSTYSSETMPSLPPPIRSPTAPPSNYGMPRPNIPGRPTMDEYSNGRSSPAPSSYSNRGGPTSPRGPPGSGGYPLRSATNPIPSPRGPGPQYPPQRNMTAPLQPRHQPTGSGNSFASRHQAQGSGEYRPYTPNHQAQNSGEVDYFNRPTTAQSQRTMNQPGYGNRWNQDVESQRGPGQRGPGPRY